MDKVTGGWINGFIGILIFSGSLPATRVAVADFDPVFLTLARAAIAGLMAAVLLWLWRQKRPQKQDWMPLCGVVLGVVIGFPLLTALALQYITSAHSIIFVGLLPLVTAIFGVMRAGERPRLAFWLFSGLGSLLVAGFAAFQGGAGLWQGDLLMIGAIIVCGFGYAEGAKLSRHLGGWQVICWALVVSLPVMVAGSIITRPDSFATIGPRAWAGLAYVSVFSMLIGFFFWYRGLAQGGIAAVGQLQLLQPFFGLMLAAALLSETISAMMVAVAAGVVMCVAGAKRFAR